MTNSCTKFEASSFSSSGDIIRVQNSKMGHVTLSTPFSGMIYNNRQAGTCYGQPIHHI